jgi:hypothetical protein
LNPRRPSNKAGPHIQLANWAKGAAHPSHFERDDADNKRYPLAIKMVKETYFKVHIKDKELIRKFKTKIKEQEFNKWTEFSC